MRMALIQMSSEGVGWLALALCVLVGLGIVLLYALLMRLREIEGRALELSHLAKIESKLVELAQAPADLDLRRLEHVLIDIRDGQRRVEGRMLAVLEQLQAERVHSSGEGAVSPAATGMLSGALSGPHLSDRLTSRLLALGFERIEFLTPAEKLAELFEEDGDVLVEARRGGVPYKGRVVLADGAISDVQLRPSYQIFP